MCLSVPDIWVVRVSWMPGFVLRVCLGCLCCVCMCTGVCSEGLGSVCGWSWRVEDWAEQANLGLKMSMRARQAGF